MLIAEWSILPLPWEWVKLQDTVCTVLTRRPDENGTADVICCLRYQNTARQRPLGAWLLEQAIPVRESRR